MANKFTVLGLKAEIKFVDFGGGRGHLCGYVEIPKGHPYYRRNSGENGDWITASESKTQRSQVKFPYINVHGGVTYSGKMDDEETFCWGFDCGHYGDTMDKCDHRFVEQEILRMAKQIRQIEAEYTGRTEYGKL
jgi:hypothetical protein